MNLFSCTMNSSKNQLQPEKKFEDISQKFFVTTEELNFEFFVINYL